MFRTTKIALLALVLTLSGCAFLGQLFKSDPNPDEEKKVQAGLERYGRSGTILLFKNIVDDKEKRAKKAKEFRNILETNVIPWLNNDNTQVNEAIWQGIIGRFEKLDPSYKVVAKDAFDYLLEHITVPTGDKILGPRMAKRAHCFFKGAIEGCKAIEEDVKNENIGGCLPYHSGGTE